MFKYIPEKHVFVASAEIVCPVCSGMKEVYEEETTYNGAGYARCTHCAATGKVTQTFYIEQEEVFEEINNLKGVYIF